jgi:hypothetical protein
MLERFFSWLDRALNPSGGRPVTDSTPPHVASAPSSPPCAPLPPAAAELLRVAGEPLASAALLSVDDAGQFLLVASERVTLGHLRAARADLPFLADVGALHAELVREDSLRLGPGWRIVPLGGETVLVAGRALGPEGARLVSGERVRLGTNLEFAFHAPDPASASAVLELRQGAECLGARRVLLFAAGPGGRFMLGSLARHAVRVAGLEFALAFERVGQELQLLGEDTAEAGTLAGVRRLVFPPDERVTLSTGAARGSRPPFSFSLEPVARPVAPR